MEVQRRVELASTFVFSFSTCARARRNGKQEYGRGMSSLAEISKVIERLDVKEQIELPRVLPKHLKISPEDLE
jgi:hypothetical protein